MTDYTMTHPHYLFVYGTLKSPFGNHGLLMRHGSKFISEARTMDKFTLTKDFPFVHRHVRAPALAYYQPYLGHVVGELYKVTDSGLEACDRLEGHPRFYCRTPATVEFGHVSAPQRVTAGIYLDQSLPPNFDKLLTPIDGKLEWGVARNPKLEASHPQFKRKKA